MLEPALLPTKKLNRKHKLPLKVAIAIVITLLISVVMFSLLIILRWTVSRDYLIIEDHEAHDRVEFIDYLIQSSLNDLERTTKDWAYWDDTYLYVLGQNPEFIDENLTGSVMENLDVGLFLILDASGAALFTEFQNEYREPLLDELGLSVLLDESRGVSLILEGLEHSGVVGVAGKGLLVSAAQIKPNAADDIWVGTLVFGRWIKDEQLAHWGELTNSNITLIEASAEEIQVRDTFPALEFSENKLLTNSLLNSITDKSVMKLVTESKRTEYLQGISLVYELLFTLAILFLIVAPIIWKGWIIIAENDEREKTTLKLQMKEMRIKNKELEDTKLAMLNVLEDEKELEEALKKEKQSVEFRVEERTKELKEKTEQLVDSQKKVSEGWVQVQQEKARLTASIQSLGMGFVMTDSVGEIILANSVLNKILKAPIDQIWNLEKLEVYTGVGVKLIDAWKDCIRGSHAVKIDTVEYENKFLKILLTPIHMKDKVDTDLGVVILIEDVTTEIKLQQTRDEFFAVASHELRTPLTAIRGNTSLIQQYYPEVTKNKDVQEMIDDIHKASVRLISIVNDFLDVSRLELDKLEFKPERLSVKATIENAMREVEPSALGKTIAWEFVEHTHDLWVTADPGRLHQVVINLLGNALKFTKMGGIYVDVLLTDNEWVKIKVSDTGQGITSLDQQSLFQKFKQVGKTQGDTQESVQGSGMGLYISKLIINKMGGKIYLERSEPGKGSTFVVELPRT